MIKANYYLPILKECDYTPDLRPSGAPGQEDVLQQHTYVNSYWSNLQHKYSSSECMGHSFWQNTFYTTTPDVAVDLLVQCIHCWHTATIRAGDHYQSWLHPCFHWSDPPVLLWFRWYNRGNQQISKKDSSKLRNPAWTDNWNSLLQTVGLFFLFYLKDGV